MGIILQTQLKKHEHPYMGLLAMVAVAAAAPQYGGYGHSNYFSGSRKPLQGSYSRCKVVWKPVKRIDYEEKKEKKCHYVTIKVPVQDTKTECDTSTTKLWKTNGFALIIPNKKILITARTKNGSQPTITARNLKKNIAMTFPLLDTRINKNKNAHGNTNGFPYKLTERLPSESALTKTHMNTTATKSGQLISLVISF